MVEDVVWEAATQGGRGSGHGRGGWRIQGRSTSCSRCPRSLPWEGEGYGRGYRWNIIQKWPVSSLELQDGS
ncbi:hypothetical protein ACFX13_006377 [Malus domestica]